MSFFVKISFLFCIGCSSGWVIELVFRRFFSKNNPDKKWINPGFLAGPWLPLYGFGLCLLYLLAGLERYFTIEGIYAKLILFVIMAICMTAIEYLTGLFSIKVLKVHLWDYSGEWGNLRGLICPRFSFFWAILGALYYFLIHPNVLHVLDWLSKNLAFTFVIGFYLGVFAIDVIYSCRILTKVRNFAREHKIVVKYDNLRYLIADSMEKRKQRRRFFLTLHSDLPMSEHLKSYLAFLKQQTADIKEVIEQSARKK